MSAELVATFQFFGGSARASFAQRQEASSDTAYLVVSHEIVNATEVLEAYHLTDDALSHLRTRGPEAFYEMCGDQFIAARITGGSLHVVFALSTADSSLIRASSTTTNLNAWMFSVGGNISPAAKSVINSTNASMHVFQSGGGRTAPESLSGLISYLYHFRSEVTGANSSHAAPIAFITNSYGVVPTQSKVPFVSLVQQRSRLDELAHLHGSARSIRVDLRRAMDVQGDCTAQRARLAEALDEIDLLISSMEREAGKCVENPMQSCGINLVYRIDQEKYESLIRECGVTSSLEREDALALREARKGEPDGFPCRLWEVRSVRPINEGSGVDQVTIVASASPGGSMTATEKRFVKKKDGWTVVPPLTVPSQALISSVEIDHYRYKCWYGITSCDGVRTIGKFSALLPEVIADGELPIGTSVIGVQCLESVQESSSSSSIRNQIEDLHRRTRNTPN